MDFGGKKTTLTDPIAAASGGSGSSAHRTASVITGGSGGASSPSQIIAQRQSTHGVFRENTVFMQAAKDLMRDQPNWQKLAPYQREALDMIQHKIGRILHGDPNYNDHWDDIGGYSERVSKTNRGDMSP